MLFTDFFGMNGRGERTSRANRRETAQRCDDAHNDPAASAITDTTPTAPLTWAQRLQRVFAIDITQCPHCGGRLRVVADVTDPHLIQRILEHLRSRPPPRVQRAPKERCPTTTFSHPLDTKWPTLCHSRTPTTPITHRSVSLQPAD